MSTPWDSLLDHIVNEGNWLFTALLLALVVALAAARRELAPGAISRETIQWGMYLFYGCMMGVMAMGHLLAVTVKATRGSLEGSLLALYPLGIGLAVPAWWLVLRARALAEEGATNRRRAALLLLWIGCWLVALGLHNLPLAVPAVLCLAYQLHTRPAVGFAVLALMAFTNLFLLVGSLIFLLSGQTFEQFSGMASDP